MSTAPLTSRQLESFLSLTADDSASPFLDVAAVLAAFDPLTIKPTKWEAGSLEPDRNQALDDLIPRSEPLPTNEASERLWTLLLHERRSALARLATRSAMRAAQQPNRPLAVTPLQRMFDAVLADTPIKLQGLTRDDLAALLTVNGWVDGILQNIPAAGEIRKALAREDFLAPMKRLTSHGFINRKSELEQLTDFVTGPLCPAPLFVYGTGGVGKSTLLAHFILDSVIPLGAGVGYVDLDRSSIRPEVPTTIVLDLVHQLQAQFDIPHDLVDPLIKEVSFSLSRRDSTRGLESAFDGLEDSAEILRSLDKNLKRWLGPRTCVLVIDTMEEAQYLGADVVYPLIRFLLSLCYATGVRLILAGRGLPTEFTDLAFENYAGQSAHVTDTEEEKGKRLEAVPLPYRPINLGELDPGPAHLMLRAALRREGAGQLEPAEEDEIIGIVSRNPMCLRLAARVVRDEGTQKLRSGRSEFMAKLKAEKIQALLYCRILLNVHSDQVRKVAYPGLVVRRVTPDVIRDVLAGPCELDLSGAQDPHSIFYELRRESALMETDPTNDFVLYHRADVRRTMLLDLTDHVAPAVVRAIHDNAIRFYQKDSSDPAARAEEIYHRMCRGDGPSELESRWMPEAGQFLKNVEDAPARQRLWLAEKLGVTLDEAVRSGASQQAWEQQVATAANRLLLSGEPTLARDLIRERRERLPRSPLYNLEAEALRFMQDFDGALDVARRGVESASAAGATDMALELLLKMALIEEGRGRLPESLSSISEAAGVAAHSTNLILQLTVKVSNLRLQRKMRPEAKAGRQALIADAIAFITPDLLRKLRAYPVVLRETAAELANDDPRIAQLTVETRGLEARTDRQAQALGEALSRFKESDDNDPSGRVAEGAVQFERSNFDPAVVRRWAREVLTEGDVRRVGQSLRGGEDAKSKADKPTDVTAEEMFGLETIVLRQNRPAILIRNGRYDHVEEPWLSLNAPDIKARLEALFPSIGRIELPNSPDQPFAGTGFVAGPGLVATARHVAMLFSQGIGTEVRYNQAAAINFNRQADDPDTDESATCPILGVELIHPFWDFALLRVQLPPSRQALRLSTLAPEVLSGRNIIVVGYPAMDSRIDLEVQNRIFGGPFNVKRMLPGKVMGRTALKSFENLVQALTHDSQTSGGTAGGAVIDIDSGEVMGIHFAAEYLKGAYAVPFYDLARDPRVAPLLNFTASLPPSAEWEPAWERTGSKFR